MKAYAPVRPVIVIATDATRPERRAAYERLRAVLDPQLKAHGIDVFVHHDSVGKGSLGPWLNCLEAGAAMPGATHVTFLPDDAILVPHFVEVLLAVIAAKPEAIICCQSNHVQAPPAYANGARWYTTTDGFTAFAGTMPVEWVREHLAWRASHLNPASLVQGDEGVNFCAMMTDRLIYKPLPSLVDHDLSLPSADGNDHHAEYSYRRPLVWEPEADLRGVDWAGGKVVHVGRSYNGNHWRLAYDVKPEHWDIERMYAVERGTPVKSSPHVFIATPAYGGPKLAMLRSVTQVASDLMSHGIACTHFMNSGDSLVTRGRQHIVHEFLKTDYTHLLQWDADVECLDPTAVRAMLESGHPLIGGAYPWRDGSGRVVANPLAEDLASQTSCIENECLPVSEVGTGFMLTSRALLVDLMKRHPELLYESDFPSMHCAPIWALFDAALEMRPDGRKRYASEDWRFCSLAREAGYRPHVYLPPEFKHWGEHGHEGHIAKAWHIQPMVTP